MSRRIPQNRDVADEPSESSVTPGTGQVYAGRFVLEVGGRGGTIANRVVEGQLGGSRALAREVKRGERQGRSKRAAVVAGFADDVDQASRATDAVERAAEVFKDLADRRIDANAASGVIDDLLSVVERFDKQGRLTDVVRLGRALSGVLALAERWTELARTVREVLNAADRGGDSHAAAWACHELGTLQLCTENPRDAARLLHQARQMRQELEDRHGLAATDHNLRVLCRVLQELVSERRLVEPRQLVRRLLFLAVTLVTLLAGGGAAAAIIAGGPKHGLSTTPAAVNISFASAAPPSGTVGTAYAFAFKATGDAGITYKLTNGGVPGLSLSADGSLSGTPTEAGPFSLTVTATGASGATQAQQNTITVARKPHHAAISFASAAPPSGTVGTAYAFAFKATGDAGITYKLTNGGVPGLSLSADGSLSGTPTEAGPFSLTVTATGASGATQAQQNTITVARKPHHAAISFASAAPPSGTVGTAYAFAFKATGDAGITYKLTNGGVPGLSLSADGSLSGTPTEAGPFSLTVTATGASGATQAQQNTITIAAAQTAG